MTTLLDLVIIGSGPAGISTALHLLKIDPSWARRLLVLEKATHPRPKLCGGGLTRLGVRVLQELGFEWPLPLPQVYIEDARLVYTGRTVHVRARPEFVVFQRAELDAYLAGQARQRGVVIHEDEPVQSFTLGKRNVTICTAKATYQAQALVAADGSNGITRRTLNRSERHERVARLLEVLYSAIATSDGHAGRYARFDFTPTSQSLQGYSWDFPTWMYNQVGHNRGVYDARIAPKRPRTNLKSILNQELGLPETGSQAGKLAGYPIHLFSPANRFALPRLVLVGDAAGADPLFGEGIGPALSYGKVAANAIQDAFAQQDFSFRQYPQQVLLSPVGRYLLIRWAVAWWAYRLSGQPWFMHLIWTLGAGLASVWPQPKPLPEPPLKPPHKSG